ncbi:siderophore-interacting protein [Granulicella sp. L60]|uniref:siderophore-interacting protein n=1 Tax=Granulicella sp. L60 TaxID=1641866 RepID=UPI00131C8475|nr:siderophore-interacting protein [Granulicella sp. L60]
MSTLSNLLSNAVGKLLFHRVTITHAKTIGGRFRRVRLQGEIFKGAKLIPGQAVQFYLGNLTKRAYTPMKMEADRGSAEFLFYMHGGGPGSAWAESLRIGDECKVMRPKDSLDFTNFEGRAIFFGDETSIAAAYALQSCARADARHRYVLEVTSAEEAKSVVESLGLKDVTLYQRTGEGKHLEGVVTKLAQNTDGEFEGPDDADKTDTSGGRVSQWIFTGQARSIQSVQKRLRELGVEVRKSKVRAYWSPGKTGMD